MDVGCSASLSEISISNSGFTHVRSAFLDRATGQGAWVDWSEIGNGRLNPRLPKDPHRTDASYWRFRDGNARELAGVWVPFFSGYRAQRTGIWCGRNGVTN